MRVRKATSKIIDILLTIIVITLSISLVTLDVKAYEINLSSVAFEKTHTVELSQKQKDEKRNTEDSVKVDNSNDENVEAVSGVTKVGRVYLKGNASVDKATYLNNACNYIPGSVLNAFDQLGFKIQIGNYNKDWAGLFDSQSGYIYIENNTSMDYVYVLSHEMGHFLDLLKNLSSESGEFDDIFNAERLKLDPKYKANYNYYTTRPKEYYAECFSQYVIQNTKLAKNNPKTYSYIQSDLNTISQPQIDYIREGLRIARGEK